MDAKSLSLAGADTRKVAAQTRTRRGEVRSAYFSAAWELSIRSNDLCGPINLCRPISFVSGQGRCNRPLTPDTTSHTLDFSESMVRTTFTENFSWLDIS